MPVVINEFEVMPEPPAPDDRADRKPDETASAETSLSDFEIKKMLERQSERLERVSAH